MHQRRLIITSGEPAGIGPDICLLLAQHAIHHPSSIQLVIAGNKNLLSNRAKQLGLSIKLIDFNPQQQQLNQKGELIIHSLAMNDNCIAGKLNINNSQYVLDQLNYATDGCLSGLFEAMVTAPVHKAVINDAGFSFSGHTEFLAQKTNTKKVVMMLANPTLKVALMTTHIPVSQISQSINANLIKQMITIVHNELQTKFQIKNPCIYVCGLNPHAGESGHLGTEEIKIITPALKELQSYGFNVIGPLPADSLFTPKNLVKADVVIAMYHDQGLPVLKYSGFGEAVNITLGLPIIRTSVDHGTALELAGTNQANPNSLFKAIEYAQLMLN